MTIKNRKTTNNLHSIESKKTSNYNFINKGEEDMSEYANGNQTNHRLVMIMEKLNKYGRVDVQEIAQELDVSTATIRRDFNELEKQGHLRRVHGGAVLSNVSTTFEYLYHAKVALRMDEKKRIALQAAEEIQDGDAIFLDSGTTTYQIAMCLADKKELTVITYDMSIATVLNNHPSMQVILTGGMVRQGYNVLVGSITENFIRNMMVDKVFLSADAIHTAFGISNANYVESGIKALLVKAGKKVILVADHTKFDKIAVSKFCNLSEIDMCITDNEISRSMAESIRESGVEIKCV